MIPRLGWEAGVQQAAAWVLTLCHFGELLQGHELESEEVSHLLVLLLLSMAAERERGGGREKSEEDDSQPPGRRLRPRPQYLEESLHPHTYTHTHTPDNKQDNHHCFPPPLPP